MKNNMNLLTTDSGMAGETGKYGTRMGCVAARRVQDISPFGKDVNIMLEIYN